MNWPLLLLKEWGRLIKAFQRYAYFKLMPLKRFCPITVYLDRVFYLTRVCDYAFSILFFSGPNARLGFGCPWKGHLDLSGTEKVVKFVNIL